MPRLLPRADVVLETYQPLECCPLPAGAAVPLTTRLTHAFPAPVTPQLAFARGCHDAQALQQQPHLQAVHAVLHTALASCAEAAISQVTLLCPPFLAAWAARWLPAAGGNDPPRLRLTIVQGYRPHQPCPLRATTGEGRSHQGTVQTEEGST